MKNSIKSGLLLVFLTVATFSTLTAQKYGHLNLGNLIMNTPEAEAADKDLVTYSDQLVAELKKKFEVLQADAEKLQEEYNSGKLSQIKAGEQESLLIKREQALRQEEVEIGNKVAKKREELLVPILNKVESALKELGKEEGYMIIFDTSIFNAVLYLEESDDVMPKIKAKLGIL